MGKLLAGSWFGVPRALVLAAVAVALYLYWRSQQQAPGQPAASQAPGAPRPRAQRPYKQRKGGGGRGRR